jgi:hypothetical protein
MKLFLNWKNSQGHETIDELDSKDFSDLKAFRKETSRLLSEYVLAYNCSNIYWSSRCCANWKNNY